MHTQLILDYTSNTGVLHRSYSIANEESRLRDPQRSFIIYHLNMINDLVNRNKGFFNNIANQSGEMSNEILKYFKLGFQPEPNNISFQI